MKTRVGIRRVRRAVVAAMVLVAAGCAPPGVANDPAAGSDLHDFVVDFARHVLAARVL